jgi:hypothetical protein
VAIFKENTMFTPRKLKIFILADDRYCSPDCPFMYLCGKYCTLFDLNVDYDDNGLIRRFSCLEIEEKEK